MRKINNTYQIRGIISYRVSQVCDSARSGHAIMSKHASGSLTEVKVERPRRHTQGELQVSKIAKVSSQSSPDFYETQNHKSGSDYGAKKSDFVYVNRAYVGSVDNVRDRPLSQPPTSVIREQYWACSKWPFGQRVLAIAVGILLGAVVGLIISLVLRGKEEDLIPGFLLGRESAPD